MDRWLCRRQSRELTPAKADELFIRVDTSYLHFFVVDSHPDKMNSLLAHQLKEQ
jgi:hypothetical protein